MSGKNDDDDSDSIGISQDHDDHEEMKFPTDSKEDDQEPKSPMHSSGVCIFSEDIIIPKRTKTHQIPGMLAKFNFRS